MKDKIIEILREYQNEIAAFIRDDKSDIDNEMFATRIDSLYPTLNRDKVMEIFNGFLKQYDVASLTSQDGEGDDILVNETIDALCSLSLPTLSEGEIVNLTDVALDHLPGRLNFDEEIGFRLGFKAALKELTKPKEEER